MLFFLITGPQRWKGFDSTRYREGETALNFYFSYSCGCRVFALRCFASLFSCSCVGSSRLIIMCIGLDMYLFHDRHQGVFSGCSSKLGYFFITCHTFYIKGVVLYNIDFIYCWLQAINLWLYSNWYLRSFFQKSRPIKRAAAVSSNRAVQVNKVAIML